MSRVSGLTTVDWFCLRIGMGGIQEKNIPLRNGSRILYIYIFNLKKYIRGGGGFPATHTDIKTYILYSALEAVNFHRLRIGMLQLLHLNFHRYDSVFLLLDSLRFFLLCAIALSAFQHGLLRFPL